MLPSASICGLRAMRQRERRFPETREFENNSDTPAEVVRNPRQSYRSTLAVPTRQIERPSVTFLESHRAAALLTRGADAMQLEANLSRKRRTLSPDSCSTPGF